MSSLYAQTRCEQICGDTSKLGVSPADVFAQFGKLLGRRGIGHLAPRNSQTRPNPCHEFVRIGGGLVNNMCLGSLAVPAMFRHFGGDDSSSGVSSGGLGQSCFWLFPVVTCAIFLVEEPKVCFGLCVLTSPGLSPRRKLQMKRRRLPWRMWRSRFVESGVRCIRVLGLPKSRFGLGGGATGPRACLKCELYNAIAVFCRAFGGFGC